MEFWSKGLGTSRSLRMDCGSEAVERADDAVVLCGMTREPIVWRYTMTMTATDFCEFLDVALSARVLRVLARRPGVLLRAMGWLLRFLARYAIALVARPLRPGRRAASAVVAHAAPSAAPAPPPAPTPDAVK